MNKTKRLLSLLLSIMMIVTMIPFGSVTGFAATANANVTVEEVSATPGSTVDVKVSISDNPGILGAVLSLSYGEGLTLTNITEGDAFSALTITKPGRYQSPCQITWDGVELQPGDIKDGVIMTLTFEVNSSASSGKSYGVNVSYSDGDIIGADLNSVGLTIKNGSVTIIDYTPGSVSGDNVVNSLDVILVRRYIAGGYDVSFNLDAADVNADSRINSLDVILIRRFIAGGYDVILLPGKMTHRHVLEKTNRVEATCTEDGNIAYWYCSSCGKYYSDENCINQVTPEETVIPAKGHTIVIDEAVPATYTTKGLTEGSHCSVCTQVIVPQEEYGPLVPDTASITYKMSYTETTTSNGTKTIVSDSYLASQAIDPNNENTYSVGIGIPELSEPTVPGYRFLGWYESPEIGATRIYSISSTETGNKVLYGIWVEETNTITYKLYKTPLADTIDSKYCSYKTSKGLADLPNPTINNYIFLGWYTDDGEEVTSIPAGTSGDIVLNAYWTSRRNLARANSELDDPIIVEDSDNGVLYFTYELGTIENIPLSDNIWTIQSVSGLAQQKSESVTTSLSQSKADSISNAISNSTVDSGTWTLSEGWSDTTSVTQEWAEQHGVTVEEANERCTSVSNTFSVTDSQGGSKSSSNTNGVTTLSYDSQNYSHGNSAELGAKVGGKVSVTANSGVVSGGGEYYAEANGKYAQQKSTNEHTGTDTTRVNTNVNSSSSTWNSASTASSTQEASQRESVSKAVSDIISSKKGYGSSYTSNGQNSQTQGFSNTESSSVNSSSALTWSSAETRTVTTTYSTDGKSEGCYRLVIAGTAHVFGVVGYDIATNSYFAYTFSVMDDERHEFLDYAPNQNFNDCENSVIPFEIPYFVHEYATAVTVTTDGLLFRTDSTSKTATVLNYDGDSTDVTVPNYITSSGLAYKVVGISPSAFAGKNIRSIILSKYIKEIPNGAFKNCSSLEQISGYYNVIGDEAFSGCTSLENFKINLSMKSIGTDAFLGVPSISVNAISSEYALEYSDDNEDGEYSDEEKDAARALTQALIESAVNSGADNVTMSLANIIDGCELTINVPEINSFDLQGTNSQSFNNLIITSKADNTKLKDITVNECSGVPLNVSSDELTLDNVHINGNGYCLMLQKQTTSKLLRDNLISSALGRAIVCKNPSFVSVTSNGIAGFLEVNGNIYVCGSIGGRSYFDLLSGEIIYITESEFNNYMSGMYSVTYDVNGGNAMSEIGKTVIYGEAYGELPTPTRDYYTFDGWYTSAEGGERITSQSNYYLFDDSVIYAHWTQNPISDWVLEAEVPEGAVTLDQKWTYDLTTTATSSSNTMAGYTLYNTTSEWGSYSAWSTTPVSKTSTRDVQTRTTYRFHVLMCSKGCRDCYRSPCDAHGLACNTWEELWYDKAGTTVGMGTMSGVADKYYCTINGKRWWYEKAGYDNGNGDGTTGQPTRTEYRYRNLVYTYYFTKTESLESATEITEGSTSSDNESISNIQKWVQYRAK